MNGYKCVSRVANFTLIDNDTSVLKRTMPINRTLERNDASRSQYKTIADVSLDAVIATDRVGKIVNWNSISEAMFGWRLK